MTRPRRRAWGARLAVAALAAAAGALVAPASAGALALDADAAILVEPSTGDVVYSRASSRPRPIASTTKLMTALLVLERTPLNAVFRAHRYGAAFPDESLIGLAAGERMTVRDLLRGMLLASGNDAAVTLARGTGGSIGAFVAAMNRRARKLGLTHTHYTNPIGLDAPRNYSSAADLVSLSRVLLQRPFFARTVDLPRARLGSGQRRRTVINRNDLIFDYPFVNGVKTGHTPAAGYVLVGSGTSAGVTMVSAVLGEPGEGSRDADTLALLRYGLARYRLLTVLRRGQVVTTAAISYRDDERVGLVAERAFSQVVRRGERPRLTIQAPAKLTGPLPAGAPVGAVQVRLRGRVVARIRLVTAAKVPAVGLAERLINFISRPGRLVFVLALAGAGILLVRHRRRGRRRREDARRIGSETA